MKKIKYLAVGALLSSFTIGAVSVSAFDLKLPGIRNNDTVKIEFDGELKDLPENMHVLNYRDLNYTSARFIAESLGATVEFDEENNIINIISPELPDQETIYTYTETADIYSKLPLTYRDDEFKIELTEVDLWDVVECEFEFYTLPSSKCDIVYEEAYIEYGDHRAGADLSRDVNSEIGTYINSGVTRTIKFLPMDVGTKNLKYIKVVLPISVYDRYDYTTTVTYLTFRALID